MIVKENHNPVPTDKFEKAGYDAERKVAYYLKMAFGDEPRLLILHDVRLEFEDGITAQMDHLLIHQYGLIIIESKSVAGKLQVKEDGQWLRWFNNYSSGMLNPIKQASLQGQTLKRVLLNSSKETTRKVLEDFPIDVLVSISDSGQFIAHKRELYPEVCKADQVDDKVKAIVLSRANNAKGGDFTLSDLNKDKLAHHLIKNHKPYQRNLHVNNKLIEESHLVTPNTQKNVAGEITKISTKNFGKASKILAQVNNPNSVKEEISTYLPFSKPKPAGLISAFANIFSSPEIKYKHNCPHCKSEDVEVKYGNNYFFKCLNCSKNYPINVSCHTCNKSLKIRRDKKQHFAECLVCKTSELFHINS
jgi:Nuclease-related domain